MVPAVPGITAAWTALDDPAAGAASAIVVSAVDRLGNESERVDVLADALGDALGSASGHASGHDGVDDGVRAVPPAP
jgi:hypothetical protein